MKRIIFSLILIFVSFGFIRWSQIVGSADIEKTYNKENLVAEIASDQVTEKPGFGGMENYNDMKGELNNFYSAEYLTKYENCVKQNNDKKMIHSIDNYIQRFVSLFLITANLRDYQIKDLNEEILVDLEISITGQDLTYLQNFSKNVENSAYPKSLSKLDAIFSKIARLKERSYKEKSIRFILSRFSRIDFFSVLSNPSFYRPFSFTLILTAFWTFRHYLFSKAVLKLVLVIINSTIIWEGLVLYWKKIKETEIKLYVETLQMKKFAADCDPTNFRWYQSLKNLFVPDPCLQYYQSAAKTAEEEVSLFLCIVDMYLFYFVRTPIKLFGISIRDLTSEISGVVPWPFSYLVHIPLSILFAIGGGFFILVLCGKRLKLSFLCASVQVGDVKQDTKTENPFITNNERAKPIRKLKPWTINRFLKSSPGHPGRVWKLTASKSLTTVPNQECQTSEVPTEPSNVAELD